MDSAFSNLHFSLLLFISVMLMNPRMGATLGINYGRVADNLPTPEKAVPLIKSLGATRVKIYDADPTVLKAFANTNIEIMVSLGNEYLVSMQDPDKALSWVKTNVQCHLPATKISCIAVGNEVLTYNDTSLSSNLVPAMQNLYTALTTLQLDKQVTVTTTHSMGILETSYPPSSGKFRQDLVGPITKILDFNTRIDSPFLINAYPFLAYKSDPKQIPINFVLFKPNDDEIIHDPVTNFRYENMLFAQIDAVHAALEKVGCNDLCVQISESGWPSKGDPDEVGASFENAKKYNGNLIKLMKQKTGTPMRPDGNLNIYLFALFNENLKPGPTSERNFGLYKPDGTPSYNFGLGGGSSSNNGNGSSSNNGGSYGGGGGGGGSSGSFSPVAGGGSSNGYPYLSVSSDGGSKLVESRMLIFCIAAALLALIRVVKLEEP